MPAKIPLENLPSHFWARVDVRAKNECWNWTGAVTSGGYGNLTYGGVSAQAHRVAYMLSKGGISLQTKYREPGWAATHRKFVLHTCDNRVCCNPNHLYLGSLSKNMDDAYARGRKTPQKGHTHANSKLTKSQANRIRSLYVGGEYTQAELAEIFGVSQVCVSLVVRGKTYKESE